MHQLMPHKGQGKHVYNLSQPAKELELNSQQDDSEAPSLGYNGESQEWDICQPDFKFNDASEPSESEPDHY